MKLSFKLHLHRKKGITGLGIKRVALESYPSFPGRVCRSAPPINVPLLLVLPRAHCLWQYTNISQSGVIDIGLSDHCMIYCTRKLKRDYIAKHNNVTFRSMKDYSKAEFILKLSEVNWNCVLQCEDVNVAWNSFKTVFVNIIDSLAPMKRARFKQRSEPWFDETIFSKLYQNSRPTSF